MLFRRYYPEDLLQVADLFADTILHVAIHDYTKEQAEAWASARANLLIRNNWFSSLYTIVALDGTQITGYGNIDHTGYLDHLYVHKDFQRMGIASRICGMLEYYARLQNRNIITVQASITARPFFEQRHYAILKEQQILRNGQVLTNYLMKKDLSH